MITVHVANEQTRLPIDADRLRDAIRRVLQEARIARAEVSLAIVDDDAIRELNRRFLGHDEPTDVLAFVLQRTGGDLQGEVIVSTDTAVETAPQFGWSAPDELLLYVIHGALHLVGYDDRTPAALDEMRQKERSHLSHFGVVPRYAEGAGSEPADRGAAASGSPSATGREP